MGSISVVVESCPVYAWHAWLCAVRRISPYMMFRVRVRVRVRIRIRAYMTLGVVRGGSVA